MTSEEAFRRAESIVAKPYQTFSTAEARAIMGGLLEGAKQVRGALKELHEVFNDLPAAENYGAIVQRARAALKEAP